MNRNNSVTEQWWARLSGGEKQFIWALMRMIQGAKHSQVVEVARAAAKWEAGLACFIKVRLMHRRRQSPSAPPILSLRRSLHSS